MEESAKAFAGSWDVLQASLPNGKTGYTGRIDIKRNRDAFDLDWDITDGRYFGLGLPVNSHLIVGCGEHRAGLALSLFLVQPDVQVLIQCCTPEMQGALGSGKFTSSFGGSFVGEHEVIQYLPDGAFDGQWSVEIQRAGQIFEITWRKRDVVHFTGLGLGLESGLAVCRYPDLRQLALLDYVLDPKDGDHLSASWALGGFTSLGTETLKRRRD